MENLLIQVLIVYYTYMLYISQNPYYLLFNSFLLIIFFGIFLCMLQVELFTGFLWVTEFSVVFISLIILFYLNINIKAIKYKNLYVNTNTYLLLLLLLIFLYKYNNFFINEFALYNTTVGIDYFDDYYDATNNHIMNDLYSLYLVYYCINSVELIIIGYLLLLGSILCINLYFSNKNMTLKSTMNTLNTFNVIKDFISFSFIKRQDLNTQTKKNYFLKLLKKN